MVVILLINIKIFQLYCAKNTKYRSFKASNPLNLILMPHRKNATNVTYLMLASMTPKLEKQKNSRVVHLSMHEWYVIHKERWNNQMKSTFEGRMKETSKGLVVDSEK